MLKWVIAFFRLIITTNFENINCNLIEIWRKQRPTNPYTNLDNHDIIIYRFFYLFRHEDDTLLLYSTP